MQTQEIKTEIRLSFWVWNVSKGIRNFQMNWGKYVKNIDTKWSIFNPLKVKVKIDVVYETESKSLPEISQDGKKRF